MERVKLVNILVKELGETCSKLLGINLSSGTGNEIFKTANLLREYKGDLNILHSKTKDARDLEKK